MDPRRAAFWHALEIGPLWVAREARAEPAPPAAALAVDGIPPPPAADASGRREQIARLDWPGLEARVAGCEACGLCKTRKQTVFGVGYRQADWMLVGEAPGADEDAQGKPFVGQAGKLLDQMLASIGMSRDGSDARAVFIANVLKCRPPGNRNPEPNEVASCEPFLQRQIELVQPRLILVMGRFAAQALLNSDASIAALRGREHRYRCGERTIPVVVTYHPAYLLRTLADKAKSWADLCLAREVLARQPPRAR